MSSDASDPGKPSGPVLDGVSVGDYRLLLGDPSGATILPAAKEADLSPLAKALAKESRQRGSAPNRVDRLEGAVADASQVAGKAERGLTLFREISEGRRDLASVSDEVDALVGLLRKLDHEERFEDSLRVAQSLASLLGLIERWLDLLRSLQSALSAAERLGDTVSKAWALHELGTLNLLAERHFDADRMLGEARDLRLRSGDTHGLALTEGNLQVLCGQLRARLRGKPRPSPLEWLAHRPGIALALSILLFIAGGAAGAATYGSNNAADTVGTDSSNSVKTTTPNTGPTGNTGTGKPSGPKITKPVIATQDATTFEEGSKGHFTVTATGTPTPTIVETGKLPDGVTFAGGVLAGVASTNGSFPILFTATNSAGSFSQNFTLVVDPAPTTTTEEPPTGATGTREPSSP